MTRILILFILLVAPGVVLAHDGHSGHGGANPYKEFGIEIEEEQAKKFSHNVIVKLVENHKLAQSWDSATVVKSYKKTYKSEPEWVVMFSNSSEEDVSKRNLYIFLSLYGDFKGANFTGN